MKYTSSSILSESRRCHGSKPQRDDRVGHRFVLCHGMAIRNDLVAPQNPRTRVVWVVVWWVSNITAWWFGAMVWSHGILWLSIQLGVSSSQLTTLIFFRWVGLNHQPAQLLASLMPDLSGSIQFPWLALCFGGSAAERGCLTSVDTRLPRKFKKVASCLKLF